MPCIKQVDWHMLQIDVVDLSLGAAWSNQRAKISKSVTCKVIEGVVEESGEIEQDYIYMKRCYVFGIVVKEGDWRNWCILITCKGDIEETNNGRYGNW